MIEPLVVNVDPGGSEDIRLGWLKEAEGAKPLAGGYL